MKPYPGPGFTIIPRVSDAVVLCCICERQIERPTVNQVKAKEPCCGRGNCISELRKKQARRQWRKHETGQK